MKRKKPAKRKKITLKSDKSFDDLIEDAFNDKSFKKRQVSTATLVLTLSGDAKKKTVKKRKK